MENWAKAIQNDMTIISTTLQRVYQGKLVCRRLLRDLQNKENAKHIPHIIINWEQWISEVQQRFSKQLLWRFTVMTANQPFK